MGGGGLARNVPRHVDGVQDALALLVARLVAVAAPGAVWHVVGQLPLSQDGGTLGLEQKNQITSCICNLYDVSNRQVILVYKFHVRSVCI